jgi:hypothetical protein
MNNKKNKNFKKINKKINPGPQTQTRVPVTLDGKNISQLSYVYLPLSS